MPGPATSIAHEVRIPLAPISIGADKTPTGVVRRREARATTATTRGVGTRGKPSASTVVTSVAVVARRRTFAAAGVHPKNARGTLDGDFELPGVRLAIQTIGSWEDRLGTVLGSFVELMGQAHDTQ
jgi:hypothetical protein